jgi:hypothetical protein
MSFRDNEAVSWENGLVRIKGDDELIFIELLEIELIAITKWARPISMMAAR